MTTRQAPSSDPGFASPTLSGTAAERADRHALYERAVQCPEAELNFVSQTFAELRGRPARLLAEDFCGTAAVCIEWVKRDPAHQAYGFDSDGPVLDWTRRNRVVELPAEERDRLRLCQADVMTLGLATTDPSQNRPPVDLVLAMNFSWWLITERAALLDYFRQVRRRLVKEGLFLLDAYGGYDAFRVITEEREVDDGGGDPFTYVWDQLDYDPVSGLMDCAIHFAFPDGSRLERAFLYRWRLWTLPEVRELLAEAGFQNIQVYWQGWDGEGEPDGLFKPVQRADPDAGWICYLSAEP